jgi:hypothetical protein
MRITIEATDKLTTIAGSECRVWNGTSENGAKCLVFVARVAVPEGEDQSAFERELRETIPPGRVVDLRMVL